MGEIEAKLVICQYSDHDSDILICSVDLWTWLKKFTLKKLKDRRYCICWYYSSCYMYYCMQF